MITGKTKNLGVMGWPIAHSLSPVLQNAAIEKAGLDYAYLALPVPPEKLEKAVEGLRAMGFRGFNVTIPHKSAIIPLLDEVEEAALAIGAVNTVAEREGRLLGYNTDTLGFLEALREQGFSPKGKKALLLGAGGAARAVIWALTREGTEWITLSARNPAKAESLAEEFRQYGDIRALSWEGEDFCRAMREADLLVNTTPLGMHPREDAMAPVDLRDLKEGALVYDVIYTPAETKLLREAASLGHPTLNGEGMLVGQGAAAFRLWTGVDPDRDLMKKVLREFLGNC